MLKPSELGITGVRRTISQHKFVLFNSILRMANINGPQAKVARVCLQIMEAPNGSIISDVQSLSSHEIAEIKNYFSEAMGPIWCLEQGLLPGIKAHDYTHFETTSRLYDFKVYRGDEPILISNKRKVGVSNTLKPSDVVRLVNVNQDLYRRWHSTDQYRVIRILDENSVVSGPIKAVSRVYPRLLNISGSDYQTVIRQLTRNEVILDQVPESFMELIQSDVTASNMYEETQQVTGTMINFIFEKILINQSKNDPEYNKLYVEATDGNVLFMRFDLDKRGNMYFAIEDPKQTSNQAAFRSKQGIERRDQYGKIKLDKLGLSVP